jgi:hypothetical protein
MELREWPGEERLRFILFADLPPGPPYITTLWRICRAFPEHRRPRWVSVVSQAERGLLEGAFRDGKTWKVRLNTILFEGRGPWEAIRNVFAAKLNPPR